MYHVSAQGVDERMINVHYYYLLCVDCARALWTSFCFSFDTDLCDRTEK